MLGIYEGTFFLEVYHKISHENSVLHNQDEYGQKIGGVVVILFMPIFDLPAICR